MTMLSAEERLLQVIQSGGEPTAGRPGRSWRNVPRRIWSALAQLRPGRPRRDRQASRGFGLARLNKILGAAIVVGMSLAVGNLFFFRPDISRMHGRVASALTPQGQGTLEPLAIEAILAPIAGRNIFQPKTDEGPPPGVVPPPAVTPSVTGVLENLQLVGIAWGAQAEAMIREKTDGRTFFLKEGEKIRGVLVKEIRKDRVVVEYEGQTKELM